MSTNEETADHHHLISTVDLSILIISIVVPFVIAVWTAFKNKNTTQDFFTARNSMSPLPVAMSILSTFISGYIILAFSAEVYAYGSQLFLDIPAIIVGIPMFTYMSLIVFYELKVSTIYEYLELRYRSLTLRICLTAVEILWRLFEAGVFLCGSCLVLSAVTPVDLRIYILVLGLLCAIYATIGGMRGVIWTDSFMGAVMFLGLLAVVVAGMVHLGPSEIYEIASQGGRARVFNFNPSLYQRQNFYVMIASGIIFYGKSHGTDQLALQRALSLRSFSEYKKVLAAMILIYVPLMSMVFVAGLVAYATYAGCDPVTAGKIEKIDQILPYLINDKLNYIPGLSGLFLAAIVCAGMSSVSSFMNGISNLLYSDLLCNIDLFKKLPDKTSLVICKAMTLFMALPIIGLAFGVAKAEGILGLVVTIAGLFNGPAAGIFLLALLFPTVKITDGIVGFFASLGILSWLMIGRIIYKPSYEYLPLSTDLCNSTFNATSISEHLASLSLLNGTSIHSQPDETDPSSTIYGISYFSYSIFGPTICIFVAICVSFLTGPVKAETVPENLISPFVRWFYYKKGKAHQEDQEQEMVNGQSKVTLELKEDFEFPS